MKISSDRAVEHFLAGYNCAESMLLAASEALEMSSEYFPRIASCVGAGLCLRGEVCGIVTGGLMAIGSTLGRVKPTDSNDIAYYYGDLYIRRFTERNGSHLCRIIAGEDFSTIEGQKAWEEKGIQESTCIPAVRRAVEILNDILCEIESVKLSQPKFPNR